MNTSLILIIITTALVNNVVLSQFLGICSFLGVSKQIKTSLSLGVAVIFVITLSSGVASLLYDFLLVPLHLEYLETIVFILVIAALVQIVEMFLKKTSPAIYNALGIYLPLITTNCAVLGVALTNVQDGYNFIQSVTAGFGTASVPRCPCRTSVRSPDVHRIHGICRTVTVSEWFAAEDGTDFRSH